MPAFLPALLPAAPLAPDVMLLLGLLLVVLALPSLVAAWGDRRLPWLAAGLAVLGAGLAGWAWAASPAGYAPADVPRIAVRLLGALIH